METLKEKVIEFFKDLNFEEEEHKYFIKKQPIKFSVSGLIKKYKYPTDWKKVLKYSARKNNITEEELSKKWKEAADLGCAIGNEAHLFGELYPFNKEMKPKTGYDIAIQKFWNDLPEYIVPFILELKMYHKEFLFAGTADILLYNTRTGLFIICDYKTNGDLFKNYNKQKMTAPFEKLLCCSFNHYQLQLSYYQILIEQIPEIKIHSRKLIWLKNAGTYIMYDLEDFTDILKQELKNNKND